MRLHELAVQGHPGDYMVQLEQFPRVIKILFEAAAKVKGVTVQGSFFNLETKHEGLGEAVREYFESVGRVAANSLIKDELAKTELVYKTGYEDCERDRKEAAEAADKAYQESVEKVRKDLGCPVLYIKKGTHYFKAPDEFQLPRL